MTSPTPNKGYTYPAHNGLPGTWNVPIQTNIVTIDQNLGGTYNINLTGSGAGTATFNSTYVSLAPASSGSVLTLSSPYNQYLHYYIKGTNAGNNTLVLPSIPGIYVITANWSNTSGTWSITNPGSTTPFDLTRQYVNTFMVNANSSGVYHVYRSYAFAP